MKSLDHVNIDIANSLYLVFNNVDGYIEKDDGNKCFYRQKQRSIKKVKRTLK